MGKRSKTIRNKRKIKVLNYQNEEKDLDNLKTSISKSFFREINFTLISIFVVIIVMITGAYAVLSSVQKSSSFNTVTVGQLKIDFVNSGNNLGDIINLNGAYPVTDTIGQSSTPYSFQISNAGDINAEYKIKIVDDTDMITADGCSNNILPKNRIKVSINGGTPFLLSSRENNEYIVEEGKISEGKSRKYAIRIWIDEVSGNEVLGKHYHGKIVVESSNVKGVNENILEAYLYSRTAETYCTEGTENTCKVTTCYKNRNANSCIPGTIIKYNVSSDTTKYFNVIHDDGTTMTLQDRAKTVSSVVWNVTGDNSNGPTTLLQAIEQAAANWTNVNTQVYTLGETEFNGNYYTACTDINTCTSNKYLLGERMAKARVLTVQEFSALGSTCPDYLRDQFSSYWLMNADSATSNKAWAIIMDTFSAHSIETEYSVRAVIEIDK